MRAERSLHRRVAALCLLALCVLALASGCESGTAGPQSGSESHFLIPCVADADCASLEDATCEEGYCRVGPGEPVGCDAAPLAASEVMVLGDVVIELSSFATALEAQAIASGALQSGQHYRNYAAAALSFLAQNQFSMSMQYDAARSEGTARVVVMDGGATDVLNLPCGSAPAADCPAVTAAIQGAEALFRRMAADGVEHVVYFFYPDATQNMGLRAGIDTLRPLLESACARSPVECHWLDLRPTFAGHPDYLVGVDGIVFGDTGAAAGASAVWSLMQERCVAPSPVP